MKYNRLIFALLLLTMPHFAGAQQRTSDVDQPIRTGIQNPDAVAVVIGIRDYEHQDVPDVEFALNDAEAVRRVLVQTMGFSESRVLFVTDAQASIGRLKPLFRQQLPSRIIADRSDVFVYFSGHGAPNADAAEGYLIPRDYDPQYSPTSDNAYSLKELYNDLGRLRARTITVILEACFSGMTDAGALVKDASPLMISVDQTAGMGANGAVITASRGTEIATWYREQQHGLMTYFWLRAMRGEAGDAQGNVTAQTLKEYFQNNVPRMAQQLRGRSQFPEVNASQLNRVFAQLPVSALRTGDARIEQRFGGLELFIDLGGDLSIDGVLQGTIAAGTAFVRPQFPAGPHRIEVRKEGYEPLRDEIIVLPGQQTQKVYRLATNLPTSPRLDRAYGLIEVMVDRGGSLFIDGAKIEDLPAFGRYTTPRIEAGPHRVRIERPGFTTVEEELFVRPNETALLEIVLRPVTAAAAANPSAPTSTGIRNNEVAVDAALRMEFVRIEPGEFTMGCSAGDDACDKNEKPSRQVRITKPFEIGKYEVTQEQWEAVMGSNPSNFEFGFSPVEEVSWNDIQLFLQSLNARGDGYRYRLPTEAEWEYAARAGTTGPFAGSVSEMGWTAGNSGGRSFLGLPNGTERTHPVGEKQPNAWGLYDMHGNVWEFVQDWYSETYYAGGPNVDPSGPISGTERVMRGGSWNDRARQARVSHRDKKKPTDGDWEVGFRCVREPIQ